MNIAILCPGLSLPRTWGGEADHVIGVNRTAMAFPCETWACGDYPLVEKIAPDVIGSPRLLTAANSAAHLRDHGPPWRGRVVEFESLVEGDQPLDWQLFTLPAAVVYAASLRPGRISVYGSDWQGEADWDGWAEAGNRSPARWQLERQIFQNLADWLERKSIALRRVLP